MIRRSLCAHPQDFWGPVCGREAGPSSSLVRHNLLGSRFGSSRACTYGTRSTMQGGPAIAANPREGSRLLRFWVKVPNTSSEIGTTLSCALVGDLEAARVVADIIFSINRPQPLVFCKVDSALDGDHIVLDVGLDAAGTHAWHFNHDGQALGGLENIGHRDEHPGGNRALGFLLDLALLLNLQLLCHSDISL